MKFKLQICTTREQSERLLKLGLKKDTADMVYHYTNSCSEAMRWELRPHPPVLRSNCHFNIEKLNVLKQKNSDGVVMSGEEYFDLLWGKDIPAWSLHRLMEMMPPSIKDGYHYSLIYDIHRDAIEYICFASGMQCPYNRLLWDTQSTDAFENIIVCYEWLIKEGYFSKDYLEERK